MQNKRRNLFHRVLIGALLVLALVLILLSIIPYLIPVRGSEIEMPRQPFSNSQFAVIDDLDFHYRIWPEATVSAKGKLLFVHGLGGSTSNWEQSVAVTSQAGYFTVAVDLPGFGYSTRVTGLDHSQNQRSRWLWQLLDQIDSTLPTEQRERPWILVGHSMGAGTTVAMTIDQPTRTAELILVDGAIFDNAPGFVATLMHYPPADRWLQVFFNQFVNHNDRIAGFLASAMGRQPTSSEIESYRKPLLIIGTGRAFGDLVRTAGSVPAEGLKGLNLPVAAIWGSEDSWVKPAEAKRIQAIRPDLELRVIAGAYHLPMETHVEVFNAALIDLLAGSGTS